MKPIYIILTKSRSLPSRLISRFTGDRYTHASLAFDDDLGSLYSFARRYASLPLPAGLVVEHLDRGFYRTQRGIPCEILRVIVPERVYYAARYKVRDMLCRAKEYRYSILGLILCRHGIAANLRGRFFCSQFVAQVLSDAGALCLPKPPSLMRPADFADPLLWYGNGIECVYRGKLDSLCTGLRRTA